MWSQHPVAHFAAAKCATGMVFGCILVHHIDVINDVINDVDMVTPTYVEALYVVRYTQGMVAGRCVYVAYVHTRPAGLLAFSATMDMDV